MPPGSCSPLAAVAESLGSRAGGGPGRAPPARPLRLEKNPAPGQDADRPLFFVLVKPFGIRVTEEPQRAPGGVKAVNVAAAHFQVAGLEWGEPGDALTRDLVPVGAELGDASVDVAGRPAVRSR